MPQELMMKYTRCIIYPKNQWKRFFDLLVIFALAYTATLVPYYTCFYEFQSDEHQIFDYCIDFIFFLDIVLSFFTAFERPDGSIETSRSVIACKYIKSFFFIDMVTTIPLQPIYQFLYDGGTDEGNENN
jgi:hypothetical protein